jgi:hypothetical protein
VVVLDRRTTCPAHGIQQRRKRKCAVKSRSLAVGVANAAQPHPKLYGVIAVDDGSVILQFVVVLVVENDALAVAPATERSQDIESRLGVQRELIVELAQVLEAGFVHNLCANDLGIADLQRVLGRAGIVTLRSQGGLADAVVILNVAIELIARGQSVVLGNRIVDPRRDVGPMPGEGHRLDDGHLRECGRIERESIDSGEIVDVPPLEIEKERSVLVDRSADIAGDQRGIIAGLVGAAERVRRVEDRIVPVHHELPVKFVRAGLGEDLDAAVTQLVVFR